MKNLILVGAMGRMGQEIHQVLQDHVDINLICVVSKKSFEQAQNTLNGPIYSDLNEALNNHPGSIVIDFSVKEMLSVVLSTCQTHSANLLIATTGHDESMHDNIRKTAKNIAIVVAPNTSLLLNLMMHFCGQISAALNDFSAGILDIHHQYKKDAPSGTAKSLAKTIKDHAKKELDVGISSLRLGEVKGEHTVFFVQNEERLEINHRVLDRKVFANGALIAAQFLFDKAPGLYSMTDVLNIK